MTSQFNVSIGTFQKKLYTSVIEEVVEAVQESFNDEGVDHSVLMELKKMWENKLAASKVLEPLPDTAETNLCNQLTRSKGKILKPKTAHLIS